MNTDPLLFITDIYVETTSTHAAIELDALSTKWFEGKRNCDGITLIPSHILFSRSTLPLVLMDRLREKMFISVAEMRNLLC